MSTVADHHRIVPPLHAVAARRRALFRETPADRLRRWVLGTAWALKPKRIGGVPALARLWVRELVAPTSGLPDPARPLNAAGLCGLVHDPSVPALLAGYRSGLIPFAHVGPLKWLSPAERCVLPIGRFHLGKNVRRLMRVGRYTVTFDRDFDRVLRACAGRRAGRWRLTWITPGVMHAYATLHDAGHAHSVEVWNADGDLVGGGYGVAIGGVFFGESMFSRERDASKIASAVLNWHLARRGFMLHDGKWMNPLLASMGYQMMPRDAFRRRLDEATGLPGWPGRWQVEADLPTMAAWQPSEPALASEGPSRLRTIAMALLPMLGVLGGTVEAFSAVL